MLVVGVHPRFCFVDARPAERNANIHFACIPIKISQANFSNSSTCVN